MDSDNPSGAANQQGSREIGSVPVPLTPQRLHAELLEADESGLRAYLQGALRDGTRSALHGTHRIGQKDLAWLVILQDALGMLRHRGGFYKEGQSRRYWILETTAPFLDLAFNAIGLVGTREGLDYVRGYFDAEGGMPQQREARLYLGLSQKSYPNLDAVRQILESCGIRCGRVHNPSRGVDPNYWRFYVRAESHRRFLTVVGSWHPRKRLLVEERLIEADSLKPG